VEVAESTFFFDLDPGPPLDRLGVACCAGSDASRLVPVDAADDAGDGLESLTSIFGDAAGDLVDAPESRSLIFNVGVPDMVKNTRYVGMPKVLTSNRDTSHIYFHVVYALSRLARSTDGLCTSILVSLRIVSKYVLSTASNCCCSLCIRRCVVTSTPLSVCKSLRMLSISV
jgi:hypothetical protein